MKKQYIFLMMILIILYITYLIINFSYREYKISEHIDYISSINTTIENKIVQANELIEYKTSKAYKNKILKEQQSFKNKGENVIYLTSEEKYNKYTSEVKEEKIENEKSEIISELNWTINSMSVYEKWIYMIFKKDISL